MYNRQLLTFIQVVESGSFTKASERLFISTVSIMKQINSLESSMGFKLFERSNHGVVLTSAGIHIYQSAKELIQLSEDYIRKGQQISESEKSVIRIGSSPLRSHKVLMDKWEELECGNHPFQIKIVPFSDDITDLKAAFRLIGRDYDCIVCSCEKDHSPEGFDSIILRSSPYCLALSRKHHLAQKQKLYWEDLNGETIMLLRRGLSFEIDSLRDEIETYHPDIHIIDAPRHYSTEVFNQCAQMNYLMGSLDIWSDIHPSVITVPVEWKYETHYGIVFEKNPSAVMKAFIAAISQ
ncbi:MAG: LysR family transcriptional regulator [Firmicutes bacterium]|nr:LysR family transcriptional regulator [Bacillota bacterium]